MNERVQQRLADIAEAITAIASHLERGDLSDGLIFDAECRFGGRDPDSLRKAKTPQP